jgi:hypothetical protein
MKKNVVVIIIIMVVVVANCLSAAPVHALTILPDAASCDLNPNVHPVCCAVRKDIPKLDCFLKLLGVISKWILGISGSLALLYFVYGGFMFLTSGGSQKRIEDGKNILTRAVIGLIIIFGAYFAVDFLTKMVGFQESKFGIPQEKKEKTPATK